MDNYFADISSNNPSFSAGPYASAGHVAIAIKATEGHSYVNPEYAGWVHDAHHHGLCVLHYHFARPENGDGAGEAEHFYSTIKGHANKPGDFVVFDVETGTPSEGARWTRDADVRMRSISPFLPWLYTFRSYFDEGGLTIGSRKIWLAAWGSNRPGNWRWQLDRGQLLAAWQYTDGQGYGTGPQRFAGIGGNSDGSVMNPKLARAVHHGRRR